MTLPRLSLTMLAAFAVAWPGIAGTARAEDCTWGKPGYRACVEGKIEESKRRQAEGKPRTVHRTAPASKRPPSLTPSQSVVGTPRPPVQGQLGPSTLGTTTQGFQTEMNQYRSDRRARQAGGSSRRLRQLDLENSMGRFGGTPSQRDQQQFDLNLQRQQQNAYPRPLYP